MGFILGILWSGFWSRKSGAVASFGSAYMLVIIIEPLADLGLLALVKNSALLKNSVFISRRVHFAADNIS